MTKDDLNGLPQFHNKKWTAEELDLLHDMVRDYGHARWFRGQLRWWGVWILGVPAAVIAFWEPLVKLWNLIKGH